MNIAICDDCTQAVNVLEMYLDELISSNDERYVFYNGEELIESYEREGTYFDVIFLDIEMGGLNGLETAKQIRKIDAHVLIIFVTSYKEYMQESFECSPFRFLCKPIEYNSFKDLYDKICQKLSEEPRALVFRENREKIRIPCEAVVYFKIDGHNLIVYKNDGSTHKVRRSMNELMNILSGSIFVQTHRSYAVNVGYVHKIGINHITLNYSGKYIPISDTYREEFEDKFIGYRERKYVL